MVIFAFVIFSKQNMKTDGMNGGLEPGKGRVSDLVNYFYLCVGVVVRDFLIL